MSFYARHQLAIVLVAFLHFKLPEAEAGRLPVPFLANHHKGFKYLGTYEHNQERTIFNHGEGNKLTSSQSSYFLSQNSAGWSTAMEDCKEMFGSDASLLYIETQPELTDVTAFMKSMDDSGSSYWLGGAYDTESDSFKWTNGVPLGPWAPWDSGYPNSATPATRVTLSKLGQRIGFRSKFATQSTRYICEVTTTLPKETAEPCYRDNDLVIVIDSSGSVGRDNYKIALEFAARLCTAWSAHSGNRVSVIVYSTQIRSVVNLSQDLTAEEIERKISSAPYLGSTTASDRAMDAARHELDTNKRGVFENIVFLTDGQSDNFIRTKNAAERVNLAGIHSYAIGITKNVDQNELVVIAGQNENNVFNTDEFDDLLKLLNPVSKTVCK